MHYNPHEPPSNHDTETPEQPNLPPPKERILSENPRQPNTSHIHDYDDIYQQPKVMRNSSSHYDTLLDQLYQEQKNVNDAKSHTRAKNTR